MRWLMLVLLTAALGMGGYMLSPRVFAPEPPPVSTKFAFDELLTYSQKIPDVPDMKPVTEQKQTLERGVLAQISVGRNDPFKPIHQNTVDPITQIFADIQRLQKAVERYRTVTGRLPTADGMPGPIALAQLYPTYLDKLSPASDGLFFLVSAEGTIAIDDIGRGKEVNASLSFWSPAQFRVLGISTNDSGQQQAVLEVDGTVYVVTRDTILRNIRVVDVSIVDRSVTLLDEKHLIQETLYLQN